MAGTYMLKFRHIRYGVYIILVIWFITYRFNSEPKKKYSRLPEDGDKSVRVPRRFSGIKTIQWYDLHHNGNGLRCRSHVVNFNKCKYSNCKVLDHYLVHPQNETSKPEGPLRADAVVFQGNHIEGLLPPIRRDNNQVFVFAERETWWHLGMLNSMFQSTEKPKTTKYTQLDSFSFIVPDVLVSTQRYKNAFRFLSLFNWTMTYRLDSDIKMLYGEILPTKSRSAVERKNFHKIYSDKTADAVWLVSHCITKSKRELYVNELRKYISVDVFGACGDKHCPRHGGQDCIREITKKYKFVLSFENTFHTDYITEKLFDWFPRDIIPVVYGMGNYGKVAPPGTIINAADFNSPKALADHLHYIGSNRRIYVNYLKKKNEYKVYGHDEMQQKSYCELCSWLNNLETHRQSYPRIDNWWQVNDTSQFSKLYNQAVKKNRHTVVFYIIIIIIVILISCSTVLSLFKCVKILFRRCFR